MTPAEREPYLVALDSVLVPLGFKRARSSFEWKRRVDKSNTQWIHLNFGLASITPSCGIAYTDLENLLPAEAGAKVHNSKLLSALTGGVKSYENDLDALKSDVLKFALPELDVLLNREAVVEFLCSQEADRSSALLASHRIRLLPLLLVSLGRTMEARKWVSVFESSMAQEDQSIPNYSVFARHFRSRFPA